METRQVDWTKEFEDWNLTCPFCDGTGKVLNKKGEETEEDCEQCCEGYLEMYWNTCWKIDDYSCSKEKQKDVEDRTNCHLIEHNEDGWYLTLSGCGQDLTPDLAFAFWIVQGCVPAELIKDLSPDWTEQCLKGKEGYKKFLRSIKIDLRLERDQITTKLRAFTPQAKERRKERYKKFDEDLEKASDIKDPLVRGLGAMLALSRTLKED